MDLFDSIIGQPRNLLLKDGIVNYYGQLMNSRDCKRHFDNLLNKVEWRRDEVVIFGKRILTKRKVAWYGDKPFQYTYSNNTKEALNWIPELLELKALVEAECNETFNSCLANLYHDGSEAMGWHSDDEKELRPMAAIASLSLGSDRKFSFKHRNTKETISLTLQNGSLLLMKGTTQKHWLHQLPKTQKTIAPRINLTFRSIIDSNEHL